jgi:ubiquitin-like-conjugating enzyme ATG10
MSHHDEYRQWPFLTQEEFELAGAFFDQRYVRAKLGPTRQIFKIRSRWAATTGSSYIEIVRLLKLPEDEDDLALALEKLSGGGDLVLKSGMDTIMVDEDADQVSDCLCYGRRSHRKRSYNSLSPSN